jgi:hypothetical protein
MKSLKKSLFLVLFLFAVTTSMSQNNTLKNRGYYGTTEFGTAVSFGLYGGNIIPQINCVNGYRFNPWFAAGAGFGFRYYFDDGPMMPFFVDLRTNFMDKKHHLTFP